jgi:hypothetical protein
MKQEEAGDTKGVIRIRIVKDRQPYGQKKKDKRTNNDLQNTTQKTTDQATRTPLKTRWTRVLCPEGLAVPARPVAPAVQRLPTS